MSRRASVLETIQIGTEVTPGTLVAADKRIQSFDMDADPQIPIDMVSPQGWKAPTESTQQKESTKAPIKGSLCFNTMAYLLSSLLVAVDPTTPSANGIWTVTITGGPAGGNFTLTFGGHATANIAYNATAGAVQSALEALASVGTGNVTVTGANGGPYTITFKNALQRTDQALTANGAGLTGGTTPGVTPASTPATNARRWVFVPDMAAADDYVTFTVEKGQGSNGAHITFAALIELALDFTIKAAEMKGEFIGQELVEGVSMTADPSDIPVKPVSPNTLDVYAGDTVLSLTKLLECYKASWGVKERFKPVFTLNSDEPSYSGLVEGRFQQTAMVLVEQDNSVAAGLMADLRAGQTKYFRIVMTGGQIESGYVNRIQITFPCRLTNPKRQDNEGVYSGAFDLEPVVVVDFPSAGANGAVEVVLDNAIDAL